MFHNCESTTTAMSSGTICDYIDNSACSKISLPLPFELKPSLDVMVIIIVRNNYSLR